MKNQYLPLSELIKTLVELYQSGKTGTLFVVTDNHSIQIKIEQGCIVGANAGTQHGLGVLRALKGLAQVKFSFTEGLLMPQHEPSFLDHPEIENNADIFAQLGINLDDFIAHQAKKILIIDDSNMARKIARELLIAYHYDVIEADNGMQGLAKLAQDKPDLILLDVVMPKMDGYKVLELIKDNKNFKHIPVMMLTSRDKLFDKIKGKMSDADEYITKPFVAEELIKKVNAYLT